MFPRDKHATISVLTFRQEDLREQDEYIKRVQAEYKVEWLKKKHWDFELESALLTWRLNAQFHPRKRSKVMECLQFGGNRGFWRDFPDEEEISFYFRHCYDYAVKTIGFTETDRNIICALTVAEKNWRNLFVYYLPVTDMWRVKVMSSERSGNGNKLQMRNENGEPVYKFRSHMLNPLLCHSEFWKQRGGETAFSALQENFFNDIAKRYGAKRGESTSRMKYTVPEQAQRFCRFSDDEFDKLPPIKGIWE